MKLSTAKEIVCHPLTAISALMIWIMFDFQNPFKEIDEIEALVKSRSQSPEDRVPMR